MRCNVCAAVNREENKFCGMCGARVQGTPDSGSRSRKCGSCGKVNEPDYQYCAMCGMRLERSSHLAQARGIEKRGAETRGVDKKQTQAKADVLLPTGTGGPEKRGTLEPLALAEPVGLSSPLRSSAGGSSGVRPPLPKIPPRRRSGGSSTSLLGLSDASDVSYLLRDEPSPRHVLRKLILLVTLAGVSTLAYYRWRPLYDENPKIVKQAGVYVVDTVRDWLRGQEKPPSSVSVGGSGRMKANESKEGVNKEKDGSPAPAGAGDRGEPK